jgi:hypothetical protein
VVWHTVLFIRPCRIAQLPEPRRQLQCLWPVRFVVSDEDRAFTHCGQCSWQAMVPVGRQSGLAPAAGNQHLQLLPFGLCFLCAAVDRNQLATMPDSTPTRQIPAPIKMTASNLPSEVVPLAPVGVRKPRLPLHRMAAPDAPIAMHKLRCRPHAQNVVVGTRVSHPDVHALAFQEIVRSRAFGTPPLRQHPPSVCRGCPTCPRCPRGLLLQ